MGLIYNLQQQNEFDDSERQFLEKSRSYVEFVDLLKSIANFTHDTPHLVAKFLYDDREILNLIAYDLEFEPRRQENDKIYYQYSYEKDDYVEVDVGYSEWFFKMFLEYETEKEYNENLEYDDFCFFKKTDIINLDCLKKIGFVDLSLLRECDEVEWLKSKMVEKDEIINRLVKNSSYQIQTDHASTAYIAELEKQSTDDTELNPNSKNSVSKLLYALMLNGGFDLDGTRKGNLNERLVSLTKEKGVPVTEKFIANWLEYLNDKYYFNKKGK